MDNPDNQNAQQNPHSTSPAHPAAPARHHRIKSFLRSHGISLILLAAIVYFWFRPPATVTEVNRPAGTWSVQLTDGRTITSEQLKGKVVLVNYWATWCPYCLKEMPVIQEFWDDHRAQGFEVVAISVDDSPEKVAQYMKDHGYRFMAGTMNPGISAAFGNTTSIPTSFVLDKDMTIRHKIVGQAHYQRLDSLINHK
jgi:thiol-disulfide isomerase/thioredoxin